MTVDKFMRSVVPDGWLWCVYSQSGSLPARAVVVSPDHKIHIGRDGHTAHEALLAATGDARSGQKA